MIGLLLITVTLIGLSSFLLFIGISQILDEIVKVSQAVANKQALSVDFKDSILAVIAGQLLLGLAFVLLIII